MLLRHLRNRRTPATQTVRHVKFHSQTVSNNLWEHSCHTMTQRQYNGRFMMLRHRRERVHWCIYTVNDVTRNRFPYFHLTISCTLSVLLTVANVNSVV